MRGVDEPLARTLDRLAEAAATLQEPWWVFGGAAMALLGLDIETPDVDVLVADTDALPLIEALGGRLNPTGGPGQFRSRIFGSAGGAPLPIEVMAGLEVLGGGCWRAVLPRTRVTIPWGRAHLFVPSLEEQAAICRLFGRSKDMSRAAGLEALAGRA